jgi:two-component system, NarL family, sensor histidine kinase DesK
VIAQFRSSVASCTLRSGTVSFSRDLFMTEPVSDSEPLPRLWTSFAIAWALVLVVVVWRLPGAGLSQARLAGSIICLAVLAFLYAWVTVIHAPSVSELTAAETRSPRLSTVVAIATMAASVFVFTSLAPGLQIWWLMMYPIVAVGLVFAPRAAAPAIAVLIAVGFVAEWLTEGRIDPIFLLQITFGGSAVALRRLTATVAQLRQAREELARVAVNEERLRFARDLHDLLGHSLSSIVLKSELAGRLSGREPNRAAAEIGDVERIAREALQQVRAAVSGYRRASLKGELTAARELLAAAGIEARIDASMASLPRSADALLGWAVREGVTNVVRHSHTRACTIRLAARDGLATVEIVDDGSGNGGSPVQHGYGLVGLLERARAEGGNVDAAPTAAGGFRLAVTVPIRYSTEARP